MNPVVLFSLIIFCISVQVWLGLIALSTLVPLNNALSGVVWPEWQYMVRPERDALFFHCFVGMALAGQAIGICMFREKVNQPSFVKKTTPFFITEVIWTALMLNASFKIIVYPDRLGLAREALIFLMIGAFVSKLFWQQLKGVVQDSYQRMVNWPLDYRADVLACLGIMVLLYVPDTRSVLARMFMGDYFRHFDSFLAPAWAYYKGAVLNVG